MDRRRRRRNLVSLQPNFRLSILILFLIIVHCHSSHQLEDDPEDAGGQPRFVSLTAGSKIYGGESQFFPKLEPSARFVIPLSENPNNCDLSCDQFDDISQKKTKNRRDFEFEKKRGWLRQIFAILKRLHFDIFEASTSGESRHF